MPSQQGSSGFLSKLDFNAAALPVAQALVESQRLSPALRARDRPC
jgi:hypothetical protein